MRRMWFGQMRLGVIMTLLLASCGGQTGASQDDATASGGRASLEQVCEDARDEGVVAQWSGIDEEVGRAIFDVFAENHPGIELEYLSVDSTESVSRIITEDAAGRTTVDIVNGPPQSLAPLLDRDIIEQVDWQALGVPEDAVNDQSLVLFNRNGQGITYNTELVSPDELPDTWDGLLDSKWAGGKIVVDPRGRPFDGLSVAWGEEATLDYVRELKSLDPLIIEGGTAGMVAVATGEALITTGGLTIETEEQKALGAPVEIKYLDVVSIRDSRLAVLADAPHPSAADCYVAWLGSEEGQDTVTELYTAGAKLELSALPTDSKVAVPETVDDAAAMDEVLGKISEIWAGE